MGTENKISADISSSFYCKEQDLWAPANVLNIRCYTTLVYGHFVRLQGLLAPAEHSLTGEPLHSPPKGADSTAHTGCLTSPTSAQQRHWVPASSPGGVLLFFQACCVSEALHLQASDTSRTTAAFLASAAFSCCVWG